ncbi:MAG: RnfH family protein [Gammaproteobacteria bacterium]|nr:RnfH family protein [Gammaproteobacteria bacterium]
MSTTAPETIAVEVAYATPERQEIISLRVAPGTTALQAAELSGIQELFPEIDFASAKFGVFGKLCPPNRELRPADRVEIYRPLKADPKEVRRRLAAEGKTMGKKSSAS